MLFRMPSQKRHLWSSENIEGEGGKSTGHYLQKYMKLYLFQRTALLLLNTDHKHLVRPFFSYIPRVVQKWVLEFVPLYVLMDRLVQQALCNGQNSHAQPYSARQFQTGAHYIRCSPSRTVFWNIVGQRQQHKCSGFVNWLFCINFMIFLVKVPPVF